MRGVDRIASYWTRRDGSRAVLGWGECEKVLSPLGRCAAAALPYIVYASTAAHYHSLLHILHVLLLYRTNGRCWAAGVHETYCPAAH